ncbi:MAG: hypothetical protein KDA84_02725 [Planctomycetaceae bacterium]|nr:hypothetical protein [Planctomycetaceae bacterium]
MDAEKQVRQARKQQLLRELADLMVAEQVEEGVFNRTPHYSVIEIAAMNLGRELSWQAQERASGEVAACCDRAVCPNCQTVCDVRVEEREVSRLSGPVELAETVADCPRCERSFFTSAEGAAI